MKVLKFKNAILAVGLFVASFCSAGTNEVVQCWAQTQSGTRCKRRAVSGERYCKQHSASRAPKKSPEKCRSFTADGKPCDAQPVAGKRYCAKHLTSSLPSTDREGKSK